MANMKYPLYEVDSYNTILELIKNSSVKYPDNYAVKYTKNNEDITKTYLEFYKECMKLGSKLNLMLSSSKKIAVIGENSYEWILSYISTVIYGNCIVPIDKDLSLMDISNIISDTDIEILIYSDTYSDVAIELKEKFANIKLVNFNELENLLSDVNEHNLVEPIVDEDRLAAIIYTSGTTGKAKGVMLSHKNLAQDVRLSLMVMFLTGDTVPLLPLHHTFAFIANVLCMINYGYAICIPKSLKRVDEAFLKYKPKTLFLVPLLVESFYNKMIKLGIGKELFGGELNLIVSGGAALDNRFCELYNEKGITVANGYGITECSPTVSVNRNKHIKKGSVGHKLPNIEIKIDSDGISKEGEILIKGDIVMQGYWNDEERTKEAFVDGFFKTGDIGYIDEDEFLFITGRKKNIIILDNGKNVYPEELEDKLLLNKEIKEVIIYEEEGEITAEIFPNYDVIAEKESADKIINEIVNEFNKEMPIYKKILRVKLRDKEFEKTTTMKIKRGDKYGK